MPSSIICTDVALAWPDGDTALAGVSAAFDFGRTGLIGANGSGKTTLLRLIAGDLTPTSGTIAVDGTVAYLPQRLNLDTDKTVADLTGISSQRAALRDILRGDVSESAFETLDGDWDVEERAARELARVGLSGDILDREVGTLSGGEAMLAGMAGLLAARADITLLDEPTNNLDRSARERFYSAVSGWHGVLLVVSHDRELLDLMDDTAELLDGRIRMFGGNYTAYADYVAAEQAAAQQAVRTAEAGVRTEKRQLAEARIKLDRRQRHGRAMEASKREPKIVMGARKRAAQASAGKHRIMQTAKAEEAKADLERAEDRLRDDGRIRIDLPATAVPAGRTVLDLTYRGEPVVVRGPERVAVTGPNGSGKTTLLESAAGVQRHDGIGVARRPARVGYLPQRLDVLADGLSVFDNARAAWPGASPNTVRAGLARFLLRGERVNNHASTLSGGERFRVALACLLLADPPPQLLLLDEPTNNLDLESVDQLTDALTAYRGALMVVSHDERFLAEIGPTRRLEFTADGTLTDRDS